MDKTVEIAKVDLREGEELMEFVGKVHTAVEGLATVPAPWDKKQKIAKYWLKGIFNGNVVVRERDTGKFYRMPLSRSEKGDLKIGPSKEEVRTAFVPVSSNVGKADGDNPDDPRLVELPALTLVAKGDQLTEESIGLLNEIVKGTEEEDAEPTYVAVAEEVAEEAAKSLWDGSAIG